MTNTGGSRRNDQRNGPCFVMSIFLGKDQTSNNLREGAEGGHGGHAGPDYSLQTM
jgi:hypothetical protein